ncbi:MAG: hypothetical protein DRO16_01930 [Thermoprotei archaeon]|nr:MAG: hypothetical protein DRO16_01930 [Thermoprotei archaeon]
MESKDRETRQEVKDLCELLGGSMLESCVDQFRLRGFQIDLSAINNDWLGRIAIEQFEQHAKNYGAYTKTEELKKVLDI